MAVTRVVRAFAVFALCGAASLHAQQKPKTPPQHAAPTPTPEPKLVFDRETFAYPGGGRRDPFKPLVGKESLGPIFDDLKLKGIIYSTTDVSRSIALLEDGAKRMYRLHRGDVVGNSRVVEIRPLAVRFAVENFGLVRTQVLEMRPGAAEAEGMATRSAPVPATQPLGGGDDLKRVDKVKAKRMLDSLAAERRANAAKKKPGNDDSLQPEARR